MALHYRTCGVVLSARDAGEADRVFTLFTEEFGRMDARAVSVRKLASKLRAGLRVGVLGEFAFVQGKVFRTVTDAAPILLAPAGDLERTRALFSVLSVADQLLGPASPESWRLLRQTLEELSRTEDASFLPWRFCRLLLVLEGWAPPGQEDGRGFREETREYLELALQRGLPLRYTEPV